MEDGEMDIVKMSDKGQLVVPQDIRESLNLNPGERFVAFALKDAILFKKLEIPKVKLDYGALSKEIEQQFKKKKVSQNDVADAVKWSRKG